MLSLIWQNQLAGMSAILKILLLPITLIYSLLSMLRNLLYDIGLLKSKSFDFPVICIGNLSVGGTGKTPHTEYIIENLKEKYRIAVLSRGYKRNTSGFKIVNEEDDANSVGDEPFQIFQKFSDIIVAVDEKRKRGIEKLREMVPPPQIVLLDDAFQHRSVKAGLNILLTDYTNPYTDDIPLPSGRLREPRRGSKRADVIVVSKSPEVLSPLELRRITAVLHPEPYQKVFFSNIDYQELKPLNAAAETIWQNKKAISKYSFLLVSAIANNKPLRLYLKRYCKEIKSLGFKDHHYFNEKDYERIHQSYQDIFSNKKAVVITEKDATKFDLEQVKDLPIFVLPIKIKFHQQGDHEFISEIKEHVRSYT